jgi:type VI secretion system protein ImpG
MRRDELLLYYERELRFIRKLASSFAEKYPQIASRLQLEPTKCEDPHVERLIEAFAMLTARVHLRLDDDFSEITDSLMGILYPHYLRPIPSMTIVQLSVDPDVSAVAGGFKVEAKSVLHSSPAGGVRCQFRTAYPLSLYPIQVSEVEVISTTSLRNSPIPEEARSALRIRLDTIGGVPFSELAIEELVFFLDATSGDIHKLYELFLRDPHGLLVRRPDAPGVRDPAVGTILGPESIRPVGLSTGEGLLEYPPESFLGYRLLQEYFTLPDKFLFVALGDLLGACRSCPETSLEILVLLSQTPAQLDVRVEPSNLKLGCTPAINLFPRSADPIRLNHSSVEYQITPDARAPDAYEVHAIESVTSVTPGTGKPVVYQPFYGVKHGSREDTAGAYWHALRRPSMRRGDSGSEVFISLVDPNFDVLSAPVDVLHIDVLCTNRALPARLPFGASSGDFRLEGRPGITKIVALRKPSDPVAAPVASANRWRLISHLSLNYVSILDSGQAGKAESEGKALEALQEILRLYDFSDSPVSRQRIAGLVGLKSRRIVRRVGKGISSGFARGLEAEIEFDASQYTGSGVFLFASVLERFLALYTSVNSFTQTVATVRQHPGVLKRWAPRAGEMELL